MWLLDHNIPHQLAFVLRDKGVACETAFFKKWHKLHNGDLLQAAIKGGFECILTKDVGFMTSAYSKIKRYNQLAIVVIAMPQARWPIYKKYFLEQWQRHPIEPQKGQVQHWPPTIG